MNIENSQKHPPNKKVINMSIARQRNMCHPFHRVVRDFMGHETRFRWTHAPLVDLKETETEYEVKVDLPGFKKEDIKISVSKDNLEISTKVETKEEAEEENFLHRERYTRNYYRKVSFANLIDIDAVQTDLADGVLTITLLKSEDNGKRTIEL